MWENYVYEKKKKRISTINKKCCDEKLKTLFAMKIVWIQLTYMYNVQCAFSFYSWKNDQTLIL